MLADCQRTVSTRWQSGDIAVCTLQTAGASIPTIHVPYTLLGGRAVHGDSPWFQPQKAGSQQSHGRRLIQTTELTDTKQIATECSVETAGR